MRDNIPILLVEDDKVDVMTVQRAFKRNNIINPLHVVANGQEALDYLHNAGACADQAACPTPGIILMDINMPVMNGIECLKALKADERLKKIPVIMLTTSKEECDRVESFRLSVAGYIIKPVEFEKFVEAVKVLNLYWTLSELP
ncbi:MAG: response regulator [Candidatus Edwardsbacteria bacterium]|jgi:CheY-like chemotaxis protein|nr:response regulator [Candidatus Edwardsbacteria bacterium]